MIKYGALSFVALVVGALGAFDAALAYDGWSPTNPQGGAKIENIRYQGSRTLLQQLNSSNPGGCSSTSGYLQLTEDNSEKSKRLGAAILAAHMSGRGVAFALTGCSQGGTNGYPVITEVVIYD